VKCGAHGLLSISSIVKYVCGYGHGRVTVTDVTSINAVTWHVLKMELVFQIYCFIWVGKKSILKSAVEHKQLQP